MDEFLNWLGATSKCEVSICLSQQNVKQCIDNSKEYYIKFN